MKRPYRLLHSESGLVFGEVWGSYGSADAAMRKAESVVAEAEARSRFAIYDLSGWFIVTGPEGIEGSLGVGEQKDVPLPALAMKRIV